MTSRRWIAVGLLLALAACRRRHAEAVVVDAGATASAAPRASTSPPRPCPVEHAQEKLVADWNAAGNAHDADRVGALYADEVEVYGVRMTRARAVAAKRAAFAKHLRDDVDGVVVGDGREPRARA